MRAKPEMKPWVYTDKSGLSSVGAALLRTRLVCVVAVRGFAFVGKVPPLKGLNKYVSLINPGLAPWAMREYRPKRAHCGLV